MKLLLLIIASDCQDIYIQLQELWRYQLKKNIISNIDYYFLKCDPKLKDNIQIIDDVFWVKHIENINFGIIYKTIKAFEYFENSDYTYILRTNLSSFYRLEKLYKLLLVSRRTNYYAGVLSDNFISGSGFVISNDIVKSIVTNQNYIWNPFLKFDDVCFGKFILKQFPNSWSHIYRYDILDKNQKISTNDIWIQYRIKHNKERIIYDIRARKFLLKYFYKI